MCVGGGGGRGEVCGCGCMSAWIDNPFDLLRCTDRRSTEISLALKQTFEVVVMRELFPHSKIDIYVQVLQADGGGCMASLIPTL